MDNEERAEQLVVKYGFDFDSISKYEIVEIIETEIEYVIKGQIKQSDISNGI